MEISRKFWNGKKVFLTGHTGFKGGWLSHWLKLLGAEVYGYSLAPDTTPNFFTLTQLNAQVKGQFGDIRDRKNLESAMIDFTPDIAFHLAAQPLVRKSYTEPVETYETNVMGTVHFLEALRKTPSVRSAVVITTDKVYENLGQNTLFKESDRLGGYDPYSNSKACAELVVSCYTNSYFNPKDFPRHKLCLASARAGNVIGGGDWSQDRLIPDILRSYQQKSILQIRNPKAIRPWQHVIEPLSGYLKLAQKGYESGAQFTSSYNFGPYEQDCLTVSEVCSIFQKNWPHPIEIQYDTSPQPYEAQVLKLDPEKAGLDLSWRPLYRAAMALKMTADWYTEVLIQGKDASKVTLGQIEKYMKDLESL